jgi:hypothetical protein
MDPRPEPEPPDLALSLSEDVCHRLIHTLRTAVPPVSDTPEDHARRDNAAIAHVACLHPANADEADLAALCIAAGVQAMDCLRLARQYHGDPAFILKCTAQAASMLRQARAMRSLLQRVQAERRKRTTAPTQREAPRTAAAAPAPAEPGPAASAADVAAAADRYARSHRKRAALIRALGRLPDKLDFGPLSPELVAAIVTGTSPVLRSLDRKTRPAEPLAA